MSTIDRPEPSTADVAEMHDREAELDSLEQSHPWEPEPATDPFDDTKAGKYVYASWPSRSAVVWRQEAA